MQTDIQVRQRGSPKWVRTSRTIMTVRVQPTMLSAGGFRRLNRETITSTVSTCFRSTIGALPILLEPSMAVIHRLRPTHLDTMRCELHPERWSAAGQNIQ